MMRLYDSLKFTQLIMSLSSKVVFFIWSNELLGLPESTFHVTQTMETEDKERARLKGLREGSRATEWVNEAGALDEDSQVQSPPRYVIRSTTLLQYKQVYCCVCYHRDWKLPKYPLAGNWPNKGMYVYPCEIPCPWYKKSEGRIWICVGLILQSHVCHKGPACRGSHKGKEC